MDQDIPGRIGFLLGGLGAMVKRIAIVIGLSLLAAAMLWGLITLMERQIDLPIRLIDGGLLIFFGVLAGWAGGRVMASGFMDKTGIAGVGLVVLTSLCLIGAQAAAYGITCVILPNWYKVLGPLCASQALVGIVVCTRQVIDDS